MTAGVQLAASVAGDQTSSLRPVSASSAFVEDAVRERKAVFAGEWRSALSFLCRHDPHLTDKLHKLYTFSSDADD